MIQENPWTIYEENFVIGKLYLICLIYLTNSESGPAWEKGNAVQEREHKAFIFTELFLAAKKTFGSSIISVLSWHLFPITHQSWIIWLVIYDHGCFFI